MVPAQSLTQRTWDDEAVEAFAPCMAASPWGALAGVRESLAGANLWVLQAERRHVLIAVRGLNLEHGRQLEVTGIRSLGERMRAPELGAALDAMAQAYGNVDQLSMCTRHAHLVRGCERQGWAVTGTVMLKQLRLTQ